MSRMTADARPYDPDWWQHLFDELYLVTDARTVDAPQVTRLEIDFLVDHLRLRPGQRILDCCGGQGRHALELAARGFTHVTVLDYSPVLLRLGQGNAGGEAFPPGFCRGDARSLGLQSSTFDRVLLLGNSFGYFEDDRENRSILAEISRVLRPGGRVLLDLSSKSVVQDVGSNATWHEADRDILVCRERTVGSLGVLAREIVLSRSEGLLRENRYFCRLFEPDEIRELMLGAGFGEVRVQDGTELDRDQPSYGFMARRMIVTGQKAAAPL